MAFIKPSGNILVKYAAGEATPAEFEQVQHWLSLDTANRKQLDNIVLILEQSDRFILPDLVDEQAAGQRFRQRLEATPAKLAAKRLSWWYIRVAAFLVFTAGIISVYFLLRGHKQKETSITFLSIYSGNRDRTDTMPDGSVVTLAKNSSLYYPSRFAGDIRDVRLQGEAFFSVTPDVHKPFTIAVNDLVVTVVGTSFTIQSTTAKTGIFVKTGVIRVVRRGQYLELLSGEELTVFQSDSLLIKGKKAQTEKITVTATGPKYNFDELANDPPKQKEIMHSIIHEIVNEHLADDENSILWFGLNENELVINGKNQPVSIYKKFKEKYLRKTGYGFYYGPSKITGKGFIFTKQELEQ